LLIGGRPTTAGRRTGLKFKKPFYREKEGSLEQEKRSSLMGNHLSGTKVEENVGLRKELIGVLRAGFRRNIEHTQRGKSRKSSKEVCHSALGENELQRESEKKMVDIGRESEGERGE